MRHALLLLTVLQAVAPTIVAAEAPEAPEGRCVEKMAGMPDYFQADPAYGRLPRGGASYCGPTALANALVWLDTHGYADLLPAEAPGPAEQFALIRTLGEETYTKTHEKTGVGPSGIMRGLARYAAERGYRAAVAYAGWRTRRNRVSDRPTAGWLRRGVEGRSNLLINIGWYAKDEDDGTYTRLGGHWLTAVGYETAGERTWLIVHDPAKRSQMPNRDSVTQCPVRCLLKPVASDARLRKNKEAETTFAARGLMTLEGLTLKRGADGAVVDGAVAFTLEPNGQSAARDGAGPDAPAKAGG